MKRSRSGRLDTPAAPSTQRKAPRIIVYVFVGVIIVLIIALLFSTYEFSIHQPDLGPPDPNHPDQIHVIQRNPLQKLVNKEPVHLHNNDMDENMTNITNTNSSDDVSNSNNNIQYKYHFESVEQWPLETTKGQDCRAIFGNGFGKEIISCSTDKSDFKCLQNPFSEQMYCYAKNMIIDPTQIEVSNGGETIKEVQGRREDFEFPKYQFSKSDGSAAFNVGCQPKGNIPTLDAISYFMHPLIMFMRNKNDDSTYKAKYASDYKELCENMDNDTITIFLITQRYEYANMYHQATDWYNFYQIIHSLGINRAYQVVFLDGHAKSQIDGAWQYAFNDYTFVKQLNGGKGPICMKNAIFVSAGYVGGISLRSVINNGCTKSASKYVKDFGPWFLSGFGILPFTERNNNKISITLICRKSYVAHPRNMAGRTTRKWKDEQDIENSIKEAVTNINDISFNIRRVHWSDYTFTQQLEISSSTDILIGVHGAGLSHILFLPPNSGVIEVLPIGFEAEPHFQAFAIWCGHKYSQIMGGNEFKVTVKKDRFANVIRQTVDHIKNNRN